MPTDLSAIRRGWRVTLAAPLILSSLLSATPATIAAAAVPTCNLVNASGTPVKHVIHIQFDNVHFRRDNPNVPSDLEQMPNLLNFIEHNGTLLANEHTPLIAHTANDLVTGLTGVYGDQHGITMNNSFEYYNGSSVGSYNTSAFTYWTDTIAPDPANAARTLPVEMIDANGTNLQAPWIPFVDAGCNFGAVSTVNMVLENNGNDVNQVFGANSAEAKESSSNRTNDFVGIAVHCADSQCSSVGGDTLANAKPELPAASPQGFGALYGHKNVAAQLAPNFPITQLDGTPITGFNQANSFNPTPNYTLGYMISLLKANVPVVFGYISDAHDSGISCGFSTPAMPLPDQVNGAECGAYAPGEQGYVNRLKTYDMAFGQFFSQLNTMGIDQTNTVFVIHADENDHYTGTIPLNPGCDGITTPCVYNRNSSDKGPGVGEVTTDLPLLLKQQGLYDFGMIGGTGSAPGTPRMGFTNAEQPYSIDFDDAPGFWVKSDKPASMSDQSTSRSNPDRRKLEHALVSVTSPNPYLNNGQGGTEPLFRFLIDFPGMKALHMITADPNRTAGIVGFGGEDHFISTSPLIDPTFKDSGCNEFPSSPDGVTTDQATCLSKSFIWLHGNFAPDIDNTWAALVGPGVASKGVDNTTWADHADLRPTLMTLTCLTDKYTHEGRTLMEDLDDSAVPATLRHGDGRDAFIEAGQVLKQINAPVGAFGQAAISESTAAIKSSNDATYNALERTLLDLVTVRDAVAGPLTQQLDAAARCGSASSQPGRPADPNVTGELKSMAAQARGVLDRSSRELDQH